jgi:CheY-like chemotaxis protein
MLRRILGEDVELTTVLDSRLHHCKIDPGQLEQVVMNLVVNARDAMPRGGKLTIETANTEIDEEYVKSHPESKAGPHVVLVVSDTGVGIDKATQARMFEPFFTTKPRDKGTGLGLSTVYGIVRQSGGSIWPYSEPGKGTTFKIYIPCAVAGSEHAKTPATATTVRGGTETILLVEDELQVRTLVRSILQRAGYRVLEASDGGAALRISEDCATLIHLLLTDVVMPVLGGREVAEHLMGTRQALKVLYMSGYTEDAIVRHGVLHSSMNYLQKPFTPDSVLRRVRQVLDS